MFPQILELILFLITNYNCNCLTKLRKDPYFHLFYLPLPLDDSSDLSSDSDNPTPSSNYHSQPTNVPRLNLNQSKNTNTNFDHLLPGSSRSVNNSRTGYRTETTSSSTLGNSNTNSNLKWRSIQNIQNEQNSNEISNEIINNSSQLSALRDDQEQSSFLQNRPPSSSTSNYFSSGDNRCHSDLNTSSGRTGGSTSRSSNNFMKPTNLNLGSGMDHLSPRSKVTQSLINLNKVGGESGAAAAVTNAQHPNESISPRILLNADYNDTVSLPNFNMKQNEKADTGLQMTENINKSNLLNETRISRSIITDINRESVTNLNKELQSLKKENFSLKLRINYMQKDLDRLQWGDELSASQNNGNGKNYLKQAIDLKVSNDELRLELKENQDSLTRALAAIKQLQESHNVVLAQKQASEISKQQDQNMKLIYELQTVKSEYNKASSEVSNLKLENKNYFYMKNKFSDLEKELTKSRLETEEFRILADRYNQQNKRYEKDSLNEAQSKFADLLTNVTNHQHRNKSLEDENRKIKDKYDEQIKLLEDSYKKQRRISQENELDLTTKVRDTENDLKLTKIKFEREEKLRQALENKASRERVVLEEKDANITSLTKSLEATRADLVSLNNKLNFYERENLDLVTKNESLNKANKENQFRNRESTSRNHVTTKDTSAQPSPRHTAEENLTNTSLQEIKINSLTNTNEILEKRLHLANKKVEELSLETSIKNNLQEKLNRITNQYEKKVREMGSLRTKYDILVMEKESKESGIGTLSMKSNEMDVLRQLKLAEEKIGKIEEELRLKNQTITELRNQTLGSAPSSIHNSPRGHGSGSIKRYAENRRWSDRIIRTPNSGHYGQGGLQTSGSIANINIPNSPSSNFLGNNLGTGLGSNYNLSSNNNAIEVLNKENKVLKEQIIKARDLGKFLSDNCKELIECTQLALQNKASGIFRIDQHAQTHAQTSYGPYGVQIIPPSNETSGSDRDITNLTREELLLRDKVDRIKEMIGQKFTDSLTPNMQNTNTTNQNQFSYLSPPVTPKFKQANANRSQNLGHNLSGMSNVKKQLFADNSLNQSNSELNNRLIQQAEINRLKAHNQMLAARLSNVNHHHQAQRRSLAGNLTPPDDTMSEIKSSIVSCSYDNSENLLNDAIDRAFPGHKQEINNLKVWATKNNFVKTKEYVNHSLVSLKILKSKTREILSANGLLREGVQGKEMKDFQEVELTVEKVKELLESCYFYFSDKPSTKPETERNQTSKNIKLPHPYSSHTTLESEGLAPVRHDQHITGTTTSGIGTNSNYNIRSMTSNSPKIFRYPSPPLSKSTKVDKVLSEFEQEDCDTIDLPIGYQQNQQSPRRQHRSLKKAISANNTNCLGIKSQAWEDRSQTSYAECRNTDRNNRNAIREKQGLESDRHTAGSTIIGDDNENENTTIKESRPKTSPGQLKSQTLTPPGHGLRRSKNSDELKEELYSIKKELQNKEKQLLKTNKELYKSNKIKSALEDRVTQQLQETKRVLKHVVSKEEVRSNYK